MNVLTPPTDSLYKFVAISGVAVVVASIAWPIQSSREARVKVDDKVEAFYEHVGAIIPFWVDLKKAGSAPADTRTNAHTGQIDNPDKWLKSLRDYAAPETELGKEMPLISTESSIDRNAWGEQFLKLIAFVAAEQRIIGEIKLLVEQKKKELEQNKKEREPNERENQERELNELIKDKLDAFTIGAKVGQSPLQQLAELENRNAEKSQHLRDIRLGAWSIWASVDDVAYDRHLGRWGIWLGSLVALVGFSLWWFKVQRFQDSALRKEVRRRPTNPIRVH